MWHARWTEIDEQEMRHEKMQMIEEDKLDAAYNIFAALAGKSGQVIEVTFERVSHTDA